MQADFYPRTPAGCDFMFRSAYAHRDISIHAPLRGATGIIDSDYVDNPISIHAPLRGATLRQAFQLQRYYEFLSTHPCGVRREAAYEALKNKLAISIHAPLRGATK